MLLSIWRTVRSQQFSFSSTFIDWTECFKQPVTVYNLLVKLAVTIEDTIARLERLRVTHLVKWCGCSKKRIRNNNHRYRIKITRRLRSILVACMSQRPSCSEVTLPDGNSVSGRTVVTAVRPVTVAIRCRRVRASGHLAGRPGRLLAPSAECVTQLWRA